MTVLLDIAALGALLLALTFVPGLWLLADRRITKQIERAQARQRSGPGQPDRAGAGAGSEKGTESGTGRRVSRSGPSRTWA
ncbi:hypothetical protein [Actinacidiphila acididurans]|uniref:Uncharacterized protein n=1 Tax=Actinacidiphila acididurans TaxID=2784346 RepID=A0ABS2TJQ4_9ACTN|nr:hypothetical protein [Actinacidiphila acididurans]MBM9503571.1 hypothetical protein [Actinacidiphila acididurans]